LVLLIDTPEVTLAELIAVIPGPDFPTAGFIHGTTGTQSAYATGRGSIQIRARARIEEIGHDKEAIIVSEIPYQVNKARLIEKMADLVRDKKIEGISDLRDESDRNGIRIVIELKRGEIGEIILNTLYKMTQLQTSFGINMVAIVDNRPQVLNLMQVLRYFLDHRKTIVIRRTRFDLRKAEHRAHILEGLLKALDHIDEIIATIRASQTPEEARHNLMSGFAFTEIQAQAILDMRLQRLTGLERDKLVAEYREVMAFIESQRAILGSDELLLAEIRAELLEIKQTYDNPRRSEIVGEMADITIEDMIADEDMVITVSNAGYIKRCPLAVYRAQSRGGKGRKGMDTRDEDFVESVYIASAHSYVLVFTESGKVHWLKVHRIPEMSPAARGKAIVNLLQLGKNEKVATTLAVRDFEAGYLIFATAKGTVKKTELKAFSRPLITGIIAINIDDGDRLLAVRRTDGQQDIFLATAKGYSIRFSEADESKENGATLVGVRSMGRAARGVRGIRLRDGDHVVSMSSLEPQGDLMTISEKGYGKRTQLDEYRRQSRGGLGIINLKVSDKTGQVVGVRQVQAENGMVFITQEGKLIRILVDQVRTIGRATQGVKVMDLGGKDKIVAIAKVVKSEDEDVPDEETGEEVAGEEVSGEEVAGEGDDPSEDTIH
jgi:DNA gyrase subunit A